MIYLKNKDDVIESYYVLSEDRNIFRNYRSTMYDKNLKISSKVLEACYSGYVVQRQSVINLSFFNDKDSEQRVYDILNSNLSDDNKLYILNNIPSFKDLYFFSELYQDKIFFEKYREYSISELNEINEMCLKNKIKSDASNILGLNDNAVKNEKVLQLTKKIKELR